MKNKLKRTLRMHLKTGEYIDMPIKVATKINTEGGMFHVDEMKDGNYRLIVSKDFIDNMRDFESLYMIREGDGNETVFSWKE